MAVSVDAVVGWLLFGSLTLAVGAVAGRWVLLSVRAFPDECVRVPLRRRTARVGANASVALLVGLLLVLARQVSEMRDPFVPWTDDLRVLAATGWGTSWKWAMAGALSAWYFFRRAHRDSAVGWGVASLAVVGLSSFPARIGHAGGNASYPVTALLADSLHVLAAGAWIGGLAVMLLLVASRESARGAGTASTVLEGLVPPFSRLAKRAVAALLLSGAFASFQILPGLSALWTTGYGRLLLLKFALFGVVLSLGAFHHRTHVRKLGTARGDRALLRSMTGELLVANVLLIVTALLVRSSP